MTDDIDPKLARLLRSAAQAKNDAPAEAPFGFDTRVVALWRASQSSNGNGLRRFVRRVALAALTIIVIGSAAALFEISQERDVDETYGNEYAIVDSAIQSEF